MQLLKIEWSWFAEGWDAQAIFWTLAIIATLLLLIFWVYRLFAEETEPARPAAQHKRPQPETRTVLVFCMAFGWAATLATYFTHSFLQLLSCGVIAGCVAALIAGVWSRLARKALVKREAGTNTGRVLESIPPHRAGFGKVYLNASRTPMELDAITIGQALPAGEPVRIVDMLDERTALVEPLENTTKRREDQPPV